ARACGVGALRAEQVLIGCALADADATAAPGAAGPPARPAGLTLRLRPAARVPLSGGRCGRWCRRRWLEQYLRRLEKRRGYRRCHRCGSTSRCVASGLVNVFLVAVGLAVEHSGNLQSAFPNPLLFDESNP